MFRYIEKLPFHIKRNVSKYVSLTYPLIAIVCFLLLASPAFAQLTVTSSSTKGWTAVDNTAACGGTNTGSTGYVSGPGTPPLGAGSIRAATGSNGNTYWNYRNAAFDGVSVSDITSISYDTYVTANLSNQAPWIRLEVDINGDNTVDTTLNFEPAYQTNIYNPGFPQGPVALNTWQHWDGIQGMWYGPPGSGPGINTKTWAQALALIAAMPGHTNARIIGGIPQGGLRMNIGCGGSWANFDGNFDNLTIGVSGNDTTYDFEPTWAIQSTFHGNSTVTGFTTRSLRGLALSKDNDFVYGGFIQGTSTGVVRRISSSIVSGLIGPIEVGADPSAIQGEITGMTAKARAIATDDRGYVYMVRSSNTSNIRFETYSADLGTLISNYELAGVTPNTEMNGLSVQNLGGTYYLYVSRGSSARIYRYNVTDPAVPTIDTTWASSGMLDIKALSGEVNASLSGMEVDNDGTIFSAGGLTLAGRDSVFKIAPDGSSMISTSVGGAMDVALFANRVYVSRYLANNSSIDVRSKTDLSFIENLLTGIPHPFTNADTGYSGIDISADGRIYVADQLPEVSSGAFIPDRILVSAPLDFAPTVTIDQAIGQNDPTDSSPINFTVTFDQSVSGFDGSDVVLSGTAGATTAVVTGGPVVYNVAVTGMTSSGTVIANIPANAAVNGNSTGNQASTSTDNSVTFSIIPCADVSIPIDTSLTGVVKTMPINTSNMTGLGAISADIRLTYTPSVIETATGSPDFGVSLGSVGTSNGGGRTLTVNRPTPGVLFISIFGPNEFQGSGALVNIDFNVVGLPGSVSPINFTSFMYNEGTPCANTTNGSLTVISGTITGNVTYGNAKAPGPVTRAVPGVTVNAPGTPPVSDTTDALGNYSLSGFGPLAYTRTPSKTGGQNLSITAFDSSLIAQHVVSLITLDATQLDVADVSGSNTVTSFDAGLISRWVVLLPDSGSTGTWKFDPTSYGPSTVFTNLTENYTALLMGDVSGNWGDPSSFPNVRPGSSDKQLVIGLTEMTATSGSEIEIPVSIGSTNEHGIVAYQFELRYDPNVLEPISEGVTNADTVSGNMTVVANPTEPGVLRVAVFGSHALEGSGELLKLRFNVLGPIGSETDLRWDNFILNEGGINFRAVDGTIRVTDAANSDATLNGRVLNANGQAIGSARVTVTDTTGARRSVLTNRFGYFQMDGLDVGGTYAVNVVARGYTFQQVMVSMSGAAVNVEMIAEQ